MTLGVEPASAPALVPSFPMHRVRRGEEPTTGCRARSTAIWGGRPL